MASICGGARSSRAPRLGIIWFLFAFPACLIAVDQSALLSPDSSLPQYKDFLKQFSAKDLLKQPIPLPLGKQGPPTFFVNPQALTPENPPVVVLTDESPKCSIPLLEKHVGKNPDPKGAIKATPDFSDKIAGRNPAPACKNWGEKNR